MGFPLPRDFTHALKYLKTLLSSKSPEDWRLLKLKISGPVAIDLSITPRWREIFAGVWVNLHDKPSPLAVSMASQQLTIKEAMGNIPPLTSQLTDMTGTRIVLHFKTKRKKGLSATPNPNGSPHQPLNPF